MTTIVNPSDRHDTDTDGWRPIPNEPTDAEHLASLDGSPWPPPTPLHCDHCGLPVAIQQGDEFRAYIHVGGWFSCRAANRPNWRGDPGAVAAVDGRLWSPTPGGM